MKPATNGAIRFLGPPCEHRSVRGALLTAVLAAALTLAGCASSLPEEAREVGPVVESVMGQESGPQSLTPFDLRALWSEDAPSVVVRGANVPTAEEVAAKFEGVQPEYWGLEVPGVLTSTASGGVALTLDACGGGGGDGYDEELIAGLVSRGVPATLFLNQRWIEANPALAHELAENPLFEIANHGTEHKPLSVSGGEAYGIQGTASPLEAAQEVRSNHLAITDLTGTPPRFFRSGTAHYDDVAVQIVEQFDERVVGFNVNADAGATFDAGTVRAQVSSAQPGSIIIAHMNQPQGETAEGLLAGIDDLLDRGAHFTFIDAPPGSTNP